jgi:DNA-binding beta-propeller fold protein YncE
MRTNSIVLATLFSAAGLAGCTGDKAATGTPDAVDTAKAPAGKSIAIGFTADAAGYEAQLVRDGLNNPSSVAFSPDGTQMAVCDSGAGRVLVSAVSGDAAETAMAGFDTEHWKVTKNEQGEVVSESFKLGPLSAVWAGSTFVVADAGKRDGAETLRFYAQPTGDASGGTATNAVGPTTTDAKDKGEGNLTGLAVAADNDTIYVCGQGHDGKSWVLRANVSTKVLEPFLSADDHGIAVNSPMQCLLWGDSHLLVLYSGKGGAADGTLVKWDLTTKTPVAQWTPAGLIDPMGMAWIPGTQELAIVDNNWALTKVNQGTLVRVALHDGGKSDLTVLATDLRGPVSCAFGPAGRLWITQLGPQFDREQGQLIAVSGFAAAPK